MTTDNHSQTLLSDIGANSVVTEKNTTKTYFF